MAIVMLFSHICCSSIETSFKVRFRVLEEEKIFSLKIVHVDESELTTVQKTQKVFPASGKQ
jgi:hypothetical protein